MSYNRQKVLFFYLLPALIICSLFIYYPVVMNFFYSLFRWSAFSPDLKWNGLENFTRFFSDAVILTALKNCILFAVFSVIFQVGGSLVLAAILEDTRFRKLSPVFRTVYFLPSLMSITVCGILFQLVFNPNMGIINALFSQLGFDVSHLDLLGNKASAIFTVIGVSQWQYIGYTTMLFIVSIQKIPADLYEAATIDGASAIAKFRHITIPQVAETTLVNMVITIIGAFKVFDEIYVMTGGGPGTSTHTLATYLYNAGFRNDEMGYASAIAVLVFLITFTLSIIQMRQAKIGKVQ